MTDQKKQKKTSAVKSHPTYQQMVIAAVKDLKTSKVSLKMCQNYVLAQYDLKDDKAKPLITKAIAKLIKAGLLAQVKGTGANGSFKLSAATKENAKNKERAEKKKQKAATAKAKTAVKPKKATSSKAKKAATPKKSVKKPPAKKTTKKTTKKPAKKVAVKKPAAKKSPKKKTTAKKTGTKKAAKK